MKIWVIWVKARFPISFKFSMSQTSGTVETAVEKTLKNSSDVKSITRHGFFKILTCWSRIYPWFLILIVIAVKNYGKKIWFFNKMRTRDHSFHPHFSKLGTRGLVCKARRFPASQSQDVLARYLLARCPVYALRNKARLKSWRQQQWERHLSVPYVKTAFSRISIQLKFRTSLISGGNGGSKTR